MRQAKERPRIILEERLSIHFPHVKGRVKNKDKWLALVTFSNYELQSSNFVENIHKTLSGNVPLKMYKTATAQNNKKPKFQNGI